MMKTTNMVRADQSSTQVIDSGHMDYVNEVAFSPYGRRLATCSGDRFVRVFDLTDTGEWTLSAQWQAHRGAVTSICWAHPEFGSLLATAGSDHEAKLWEERNSSGSNHGSFVANHMVTTTTTAAAATTTTAGTTAARWTSKASLTEARRAVTCLEFAPRHWGLKVAVGSGDGLVRIYEAVDIMNLAQWPLAATLQCFAENNRLGVTCLSWCNGRFEPPTLVVGGSHLVIFRYSEVARAWQAMMQLPAPEKGSVLDVAWAPNVGRRFHYIASAENQQLRIYKLLRQQQQQQTASSNSKNSTKSGENKSEGGGSSSAGGNSSSSGDKQQQHHLLLESSQTVVANAWRCQWNVTGTVLASSGDAGIVQLWKPSVTGNFVCVSQVQGDLSQVSATAPPPPVTDGM